MTKLSDIAKASGYSTYSVSCALRKCGNLSESTRKKILKVADDLGYRGNAAASILAMQRGKNRGAAAQIKIAMFVGYRRFSINRIGFENACRSLGFDGDIVNQADFKNPRHMIRVLWNRGYKGIVLDFYNSYWEEKEWLQADWSLISAVKITRVMPNLMLNLVRHSAFEFMNFTLRETIMRGYRRIAALAISSPSNEDDFARLGALLAVRDELKQMGGELELRKSNLVSSRPNLTEDMVAWLREYRPDAVVGFPYNWVYPLESAGFCIPQDFGFATPYSSEKFLGARVVSGCDPQSEEIEFRAIQRLHRLIQAGETGTSPYFTEEVVHPIWVDCGTLPYKTDSCNKEAALPIKEKAAQSVRKRKD